MDQENFLSLDGAAKQKTLTVYYKIDFLLILFFSFDINNYILMYYI